MNDRLVLAIDTAFGPVGAALATLDGALLASVEADNAAGTQAETLPPLIARMLTSAGVGFQQLARIAVTVGPGAFTGMRVGLAFAKGLRLATGATILGVTTLECLAAQAASAQPGRQIGVLIDAKREEVYFQIFTRSLEPITSAVLVPLQDAADIVRRNLPAPAVLTGSGATLIRGMIEADAVIVAHGRIDTKLLAVRAIGADPTRYPASLAYLRAPDARLPG